MAYVYLTVSRSYAGNFDFVCSNILEAAATIGIINSGTASTSIK
jgi:hypothetical protein